MVIKILLLEDGAMEILLSHAKHSREVAMRVFVAQWRRKDGLQKFAKHKRSSAQKIEEESS